MGSALKLGSVDDNWFLLGSDSIDFADPVLSLAFQLLQPSVNFAVSVFSALLFRFGYLG